MYRWASGKVVISILCVGLFVVGGLYILPSASAVSPQASSPGTGAVVGAGTLDGVQGNPSLGTVPTSCGTANYTYEIDIWNNKTAATTTYEQPVRWAPSSFKGFRSGLTNLEVAYSNGTPIETWVENNASSTSNSTLMWLRLYSIAGNTEEVVYLYACSNYMMNLNGPTGEAPELDAATYGGNDNGRLVFNFYDNFSSTSLKSYWQGQSAFSGLYGVSNGFNESGFPGSGDNISTTTKYSTAKSGTVDFLVKNYAINPSVSVLMPAAVGFGGNSCTGCGDASMVGWDLVMGPGGTSEYAVGVVGSGTVQLSTPNIAANPWQVLSVTVSHGGQWDNFTMNYSKVAVGGSCNGSDCAGYYNQSTSSGAYQPAANLPVDIAGGFNPASDTANTPSTILWIRERYTPSPSPQTKIVSTGSSVPPAPTNLAGTSNETSVSLTWTQATGGGILNNTVYRYSGSTCAGTAVKYSTAGAATAYTVSGLTSSTSYSFEVTAWNSTGQGAASSCFAKSTTSGPPKFAVLGQTSGGPTSLTLYWSDSLTTTSTYLDWAIFHPSSGCGSYTNVSLGSDPKKYDITGLPSNTLFCAYVVGEFGGLWGTSHVGRFATQVKPVAYEPILLYNPKKAATGNYNQLIHLDSAALSTWLNANDSNIEFSYANGTVIDSWFESNVSNGLKNTVVWLKLWDLSDWTGNFYVNTINVSISASTNYTIHSYWGPTGVAPQLTNPYGAGDDGARVFPEYYNFSGTSLPSAWSTESGWTGSVSNGVTISATPTGCGGIGATIGEPIVSNVSVDALGEITTGHSVLILGMGSSSTFTGCNWWSSYNINQGQGDSPSTAQLDYILPNGTQTASPNFSPITNYNSAYTVGGLSWQRGKYVNATQNYTNLYSETWSTVSGPFTHLSLGTYCDATCVDSVQWLRVRNMSKTEDMLLGGLWSPSVALGSSSSTTSAVTVAWTNPTNATAVNVTGYNPSSTGCGNEGTTSFGVATTHTFTALSSSTTYCVGIQFWSLHNSSQVKWVNVTTKAIVIPAPTGLSVVGVSVSAFTLEWNGSTVLVTNYTAYIGTTCGTWTGRESTSGNYTNYTFTGLTGYTDYCVSVRGWDGSVPSPFSSNLTVETVPGSPPYPTDISLSASVTSIAITWKLNPSYTVTNVTVWYGTNGCGAAVPQSTHGNKTAWTLDGLASDTTYCVRLQAWSVGFSSALSPSSYATTTSGGGGGGGGGSGTNTIPNGTTCVGPVCAPTPTPRSIPAVVLLEVVGLVVAGIVVMAVWPKPKEPWEK